MSRSVRGLFIVLVMIASLLALPAGVFAVEQGTITVTKTWPPGQEPSEMVQVCFAVSSDAMFMDVLGTACTADTYTEVFGPSEPPLATGVIYYVWEVNADTGEILVGPIEAVIPDTTGNVDVAFVNHITEGQSAIEVHVSACPSGVAAGTLFDNCHDNGIVGDQIILDGPVYRTGTTSGDIGAVRFDGLPEGVYTIAEALMTGDFASYEVYCSTDDGATQVPIEYRGNGRAAVQFYLGPDQAVICDWYNIPAGVAPTAVPAEPTVAPTPVPGEAHPMPTTAPTVVTLPSTGTAPDSTSGPGPLVGLLAASTLLAMLAAGIRVNSTRRR